MSVALDDYEKSLMQYLFAVRCVTKAVLDADCASFLPDFPECVAKHVSVPLADSLKKINLTLKKLGFEIKSVFMKDGDEGEQSRASTSMNICMQYGHECGHVNVQCTRCAHAPLKHTSNIPLAVRPSSGHAPTCTLLAAGDKVQYFSVANLEADGVAVAMGGPMTESEVPAFKKVLEYLLENSYESDHMLTGATIRPKAWTAEQMGQYLERLRQEGWLKRDSANGYVSSMTHVGRHVSIHSVPLATRANTCPPQQHPPQHRLHCLLSGTGSSARAPTSSCVVCWSSSWWTR